MLLSVSRIVAFRAFLYKMRPAGHFFLLSAARWTFFHAHAALEWIWVWDPLIRSFYFDCIIEQVVNIYRFWWCQNVVTKMSANVRMEVNVVEESAFGLDFINILRPNFSFVWVFDVPPPTRKSRIFLVRCWNLFKSGNIGWNFFSSRF